MSRFLIYIVLSASLVACSKEKRFSKRLMKGETWQVKEVTVAGQPSEFSGTWLITENVDIYQTVPSADWTSGSFDAHFLWQFRDKGKTFEIRYTPLCAECENDELDTLDYFVNGLSGKYTVEKHGRKKMVFKSSVTNNWHGNEVSITVEK